MTRVGTLAFFAVLLAALLSLGVDAGLLSMEALP